MKESGIYTGLEKNGAMRNFMKRNNQILVGLYNEWRMVWFGCVSWTESREMHVPFGVKKT